MESFSFEKHVWAEIDLDALRANFAAVQRHAPGRPLCAVVKADAYGHGAVQCARALAQAGAAWLAVSCLAEAVQLRRAGLTLPILILGHVQPSYASALIQHQLTAACYSSEQAAALSQAAQAAGGRVQVHLKADTGMGRIGFACARTLMPPLPQWSTCAACRGCKSPAYSSILQLRTRPAPTPLPTRRSSTGCSCAPTRH